VMPNIAKEWAESLDKKGQPGTLVLNTYLELLRGKNVEMARDWSKD